LSAALLASLALVGHAAMRTGVEGLAQRANHAAHLLTAGAWLGGLLPFLLCLRAYADSDLRPDAVDAMTRSSFWGQFIVAAIVLTGAVNVALISGRAPIPPTTLYRALLDAKILTVGLMISLAVFNRFCLAPRLAPGAMALALLRATSAIEVALGTAVVALVSVFALLDPA
jgi:putative copper resistance protein D